MKDPGTISALEPAPRPVQLPDGADYSTLPIGPRSPAPPVDVDLLLAQENWIRAVARHLVRDPARAEDVAQETLLAALQSPPRDAEDPRRLRAWLGRVAHNLAHLDTRRRMRRHAREEQVARSESQSSVAEIVMHGSILSEVELAVSELDEPYQSAVRARYFEGKSTQQIAAATSTTDNAVRKRLWRAREKLRQNLDRRHNGERLAWFNALAPLVALPSPTGSAVAELGTNTLGHGASAAKAAAGAGWKAAAAALPLVIASAAAIALARGQAPSAVVNGQLPDQARLSGQRVPVAFPPSLESSSASNADAQAPAILQSSPAQATGERSQRQETPGETPVPQEADDVEAALPLLLGRVLHARDGLPVAGVQVGLQPLDGQAGEPLEDLATTDANGQFALALPEQRNVSQLTLLDPRLTTLRRGTLPSAPAEEGVEQGTAEQLFIVADAIDLEGRVVDPSGLPVPGAEVALELSERYFVNLAIPLDSTFGVARMTTTNAEGRFRLSRLPSGEGASLRVIPAAPADAWSIELQTVALDLPQTNRYDLLVALEALSPPQLRLAGTVLLENLGPARDARVQLGRHVTHTDEDGRFELELQSVDPQDDLRASKEGWIEAALDDFGAQLVRADPVDLRDGVRLTLVERARSLDGYLEGLGGSGAWRLGSSGDADYSHISERDSQDRSRGGDGPEYNGNNAGGDESGGHDNSGGGEFGANGEDGETGPPPPPPLKNNSDRPGPTVPPTGRLGEDGEFELPGFDPRNGGRFVQGFDPTDGRVFRVGPITPGDDPRRISARPLAPRPRWQGRLVDPTGRPVGGARVRVSVLLGVEPGPAGLRPLRWESDVIVLTADDGRFVLERVPALLAELRIEHPDVGTTLVRLPDSSAGPDLGGFPAGPGGAPATLDDEDFTDVVVPRLRAFRVRATAVPAAHAFRLEDAQGGALLLRGAHAELRTAPLFDGDSLVLRVTESARFLILLDAAGEALVRIPIQLQAGAEPTLLIP